VKPPSTTLGLATLVALAGCASHADVVRLERRVATQLREQRDQIQSVQREVQRLRASIEESGGTASAPRGDRLSWVEQRVMQLERQTGTEGGTVPPGEVAPTPPATASATPPPAVTAPPVRPKASDDWRQEVAREQAAAGAVNVPERAEYLALLDGVALQDCARAVPQLNGFASSWKESPLADNALYWAGRCYERTAQQEDAISKFYEVGTRYPKGDKAPAALWAQANLFLQMGNSPDARIVFSKLIRDYPSSDEAAHARTRLSEIED